MKGFLPSLLFSCFLVATTGYSQAGYYQFSSSTGTLEVQPGSGVTTLVAAASADGASALNNIGFSVNYAGTAYTQLSVSANGLMRLGPTAVTTENANNFTSGTNVPKIMAFWDNMATGTNASGSGVRTWTVGTTPNRKKVVDYKLASNNVTTSPWDFQFQVWIYETTGVIEFVYGAGPASGMTASVGLGGKVATDFLSVTPTGPTVSNVTGNNAVAANPGSGTKYTFTPTPLTGTKTVGTGMDFPTLKAAVDAVNFFGVGAGGVTFNISGGHVETVPAGVGSTPAGLCIMASGTAANPIIFQWNGVGAKPVFKAAIGVGNFDFVIGLCGVGYVTLDGLDIQEDNVVNTTNARRAEIGIGLFKQRYNTTLGNIGCHNITVKNCKVTLTRDPNGWANYSYCRDYYFSTGIKASAFTSSHQGATNFFEGGNPNGGIKSMTDVHRNCVIISNEIDNCTFGITFADRWAEAGGNVFAGAGNIIGQSGAGNTITNWGLKPGTTINYGNAESDMGRVVAGIAIGGQKDYTIEYNTVTTGTTNNLNTDGGPVSYCGILAGTGYDGNHWPHHAAGFFAKINNNTISGIDVTTGTVDNAKCAYGISFAQFADHVTNTNLSSRPATGNVEITNNTISNIVVKGGDCQGISCKYYYEYFRRSFQTDDRTGGFQSNATVTISNNTIKGMTFLTRTSNDAYGHGIFSAIYWMHGQNNLFIENNTIGGAGADGFVRGVASHLFIARNLVGTRVIYANAHFPRGARTLVQVNGNTITNVDVIANAAMTGANNWGVGFSGIFVDNGATTNNIQNNTITECDVANGSRNSDTEVEISFIRFAGKPRTGNSTANVSGNQILNNTRTSYKYYSTNWGTGCFTAGIFSRYDASNQTKNIYNNLIDGITGVAVSAASSHLYHARIEGIKVYSRGSGSVVNVYDNSIKNLGGDTYNYAQTAAKNDIYNYHRAFNTVGINVARYHRARIYNNSICNLSTTSTGFTSDQNYANGVIGIMYGNDVGESAPNATQSDPKIAVYNNFIGGFTAPAIRSRIAVVGAFQWGINGPKLFAHNTIAFGALDGGPTGRLTSSTGGAFGVCGWLNHDYYRDNKTIKSAFVNNVISINADCKGTGMGTAWRHIELSPVRRAWRGIATYSSGNVYFVNDDANNYIYGQGLTFNTAGGIRNCYGYGTSVTTNATHNLVNDNGTPNGFNQICGKYKSFMGGREKGSFIDLNISEVMQPMAFTGTGGCSSNLNIANGADSYVFRGVRLASPSFFNIGTDNYGTARGTSNVTSGAHENNGNISGPVVQLIDFAYEPICDGVCTGAKTIVVTITPPEGKTIATAAGKVPRLYFRRIRNNSIISAAQSDNNVMVDGANNNATGTEGWRWVEATTVAGDDYTFDVNEALLKNNIVTTPTYTVEYFIIAETSDGTICNWTSGDLSSNCPATVDLFSISGAATVPADDDGDTAIDENSVDDRYTVYTGASVTKSIEFVNNGIIYTANLATPHPVCGGDEIQVNGIFTIGGEEFNEGCIQFKLEVADNATFTVGLESFEQATPNFTYTMPASGIKFFRIWLHCGGVNVTGSNTPYVQASAGVVPVNTSTIAPLNSCVGVNQSITLSSSTATVGKFYWVVNRHGKVYANPPASTVNLSQNISVNPTDTIENGTWHSYVTLSTGNSLLNLGVKGADYYDSDAGQYVVDGSDIDTTKGVAFQTSSFVKLNAISVLDDPNDGIGSAGFNISLYSKTGVLLYKTAAQSTTNGQLKQIALTNWYIPPGEFMIVMGASVLNVEPTGGLGIVGAPFPIGIPNTATPAITLLGGVGDLDFEAYDNATNNYFFDWDVTVLCTSNDVPFEYKVNPASCCAMPAPAVALINAGTEAPGLEASKCANITGDWIYYFDPVAPSKLLCAIDPNGNAWNPTAVVVYNTGASSDSEHLITDGSSTSEVMPYMVQFSHDGDLTVNGGVKVRMFYPSAQKAIIDAYGIKTWFKYDSDKQGVLDALEPAVLPGKIDLTPDASGTENGVPFVEFHNITSFSTFGYFGAVCEAIAVIAATENSCTPNDDKVLSGDAVNLTASGGVSYLWEDNSTNAMRTVNPVASSTYTVTVTDGNGCTGTTSIDITVTTAPTPSIVETDNSCAPDDSQVLSGDAATLTASGGGTYSWDDASSAAVRVVNPTMSATYTVTVTNADGCTASATATVNVVTLPVASIVGSSSICIGEMTSASPTMGGTWASSDPAVATIANDGVITAVSAGSATFTFTSTATGCVSVPTSAVTVNPTPAVSITGASTICVGSSTTLSPDTDGTWVSSAPGVATVSNDGIVTGISAGMATFTYTDSNTGCSSDPTTPVTVDALPVVSITGSTAICVGLTTTLSPTTGGTWASSNAGVATVTNAGVVTGVSAGSVTFIFTETATGCESAATAPVTVNALPTVSITGSSSICIGATTGLSPTMGGTWVSSNPAVATVTNDGVVTAVSAGTATFTFTNTTTGCVSLPTAAVTVNSTPVVSITGADNICIGATTTLSPATGGTWASSNPAVATVTNAGVVTGVTAGSATFTFTNTSTGCVSDPTAAVTITAPPSVSITGSTTICVGTTTTLSPTTGGTWSSSNPAVATVTNDGIVTGVSAGSVTFTFTSSTAPNCSATTAAVTIVALPTVSITGASSICPGTTTTLSPTTGGTWASSNPAVATVTNAGVVTGVSAGSVTFTFTSSGTGCTSLPTATITVNAKPVVSITGSSSICVGFTTTLSPGTGGTWVSSDPATATVTNAGVVTAVSAGTATFTFTNSVTGCVSDPTPAVTVNPIPTVSVLGSTSICIGGVTGLSPTTGGTWASSNPAVATVTNAGVVTGVSAGSVTFTFTNTSTGCVSLPTTSVTVNAPPTVSITGSNSICISGTTTLSPTTGGTWASSNPAVATVTNAGVVTGVSAGSVTFIFTNSTTGCESDPTLPVTVNATPAVSITGSSSICVGATTTLSPTTGGTWASSDPSVATVTNGGVVSGISAGTATFTFTDAITGCVSAPTPAVTVNPLPTVTINGPSTICVGNTTGLSPSSGGTWASSDPAVATITNAGIVTGVSAGSATFIFTNSTTGCSSAPTSPVTVNPIPVVSITGPSSICVDGSTTLSPSTGGTWVSTNPSVATVTNAGVVTGVSAGTATFIYTNSTTGCVSLATAPVTVEPIPIVSIIGATSLCIGDMTGLSPATGGTWSSSNPAVATVTNDGVVTAVSAGSATFTFTNSTTGCVSAPTAPVTVNSTPVVNITGMSTICEGATTTLSPTTGGTWASSNPSVATVTNAGVVSGVGAGSATFTFTSTNGCASLPTEPVTVNPLPVVSITGLSSICVNATTTLSPTTGGTWVSSNPAVATVSNSGIVTGVSAGSATFTFTNSITGCVSVPTLPVTVNALPTVSITGASSICVAQTTTLSPATGGTWASSNPAVATVTNAGVVTGVSAGTATFTFTHTATGCISAPTGTVTINAIPVVSITGSSSICIGATTALSPTTGGTWVSSDPAVATVTNAGVVTGVSAGSATFTFTHSSTGCVSAPTAPVTVNAAPAVSITGSTSICVGNTTTLSPTTGGTWVSSNPAVATVTNAGVVTGVSAGTASFTFTDAVTGCVSAPTGLVTVNAAPIVSITGLSSICVGSTTTLSPTTGGTWVSSNPAVATVTNGGVVLGIAAGTATFTFTNTSTGCVSAPTPAVTVNALPSVSITGLSDICVGSTTTLSPTTGGTWASSNPAVATVTNAGLVTGVSGGSVTFTFTSGTTGCVSTPTPAVTVTACNSLVAVKAFLGGPYDDNTDWMKDNLREDGLIPNAQPYDGPQYDDFDYNGTETIGAGVLDVTGANAIVDWVLLELRDQSSPGTVVARKAALIQRDGDVVEASDGTSEVVFVGAPADNYYVVIRHRNHLGVMTDAPVALSGSVPVSVNFTTSATGNYQLPGPTGTAYAQRTVLNGKRALWEGNMSNISNSGNQIHYQGSKSDSDEAYYRVLLDPGNIMVLPNYIVIGYDRADGNMDGMVIYQGGDSDADIPFFIVFPFPDNTLFLPNYVIYEQIP